MDSVELRWLYLQPCIWLDMYVGFLLVLVISSQRLLSRNTVEAADTSSYYIVLLSRLAH